jgi:predicted metal-binding membrane protein
MQRVGATIAVRAPRGVAPVLVGATLAAWAVVVARMRDMDAGPGTDLGSAGSYLGIWVTMMAAMMLPSATPMVMFYAKAAAESGRRPALAAASFVTGYLIARTGYGLVAYGLFRLVRGLDPSFLAWDRAGPDVAGAAIVLAGAYQLTPLKLTCLRSCRSPLSFVMRRWRRGVSGGVRMGVEHGGSCIGCCWALMVVLFAVGVMSITWMVVVAAFVCAEKVLPIGGRVARTLALVLVAVGIWVAVAAGSVPGLTRPGSDMKMNSMLPSPARLPS